MKRRDGWNYYYRYKKAAHHLRQVLGAKCFDFLESLLLQHFYIVFKRKYR